MLRAYRLIITNNPYAPENLWETEQPYIDNLSRSARAFGHHMKQRFFLNEKALNWENLRIWHTHYKPKPAHEDVPNWQTYLEWYRRVVTAALLAIHTLETQMRPMRDQKWYAFHTLFPAVLNWKAKTVTQYKG